MDAATLRRGLAIVALIIAVASLAFEGPLLVIAIILLAVALLI